MNEAIELHDTRIVNVLWNGTELHLRLHAFVHRSLGEIGVDTTEGWWRDYEWVVSDARLIILPEVPWWIVDGSLNCGGRSLENLIPLPGPILGLVELHLVNNEGSELHISGTDLIMQPLSEGEFEGMSY